jgi:hypothetical protein
MSPCLVNHHRTGHPVFVVCTEQVVMCPVIHNPASFEVCTVIHFLHSENLSGAEIHHLLPNCNE